ncbi:beta-lactamase [Chloropicon primus]|uniref:Beta-lactamase n=1 Tax=Chloropicon primus TaxID=1764295 RepID=A0A5B8MRQ2_9CHLO|nr:beta-lactamase [Chloropicon primus]UPR02347.1 beta-lactamase [Chloropicon primus]|eukprot:QDZ23133.1 beta-lactamase [Chloropicon primus]
MEEPGICGEGLALRSGTDGTLDDVSDDQQTDISRIMHAAIAEKVFPGGVVCYGKLSPDGKVLLSGTEAFGTLTFESNVPVQSDSVFDLASLTKVLVTSTAVLLLVQKGDLELDGLVSQYLPEFGVNGKESVTIRHLLTHTAGLKAWYNFNAMGLDTKEKVVDFVLQAPLVYAPGAEYWYSDLSMIVLGVIVEKISGQPLDGYAKEFILRPLGMESSGYYRPVSTTEAGEEPETPMPTNIVPTEVDTKVRERLLWGEVHDLNAYLMGGVAGHAGLFSNALDISKFCSAVLRKGLIEGAAGGRLYSESSSSLFLSRLSDSSPYGFGWNLYGEPRRKDTEEKAVEEEAQPQPPPPAGAEKAGEREERTEKRPEPIPYRSGGRFLSQEAVGHTGFTGTSIWLDPAKNFYVILLTNAVHPNSLSESGDKIKQVRPAIAEAAFRLCFPEEEGLEEVDRKPLLPPGSDKVGSISSGAIRMQRHWRQVRDITCFLAVCLWSTL